MPINVVFDIDSCIASHIPKTEYEEFPTWIDIFKSKGLYIDAVKPHIFHPGMIELIQLMDSLGYFRFLFFSSGDSELRNNGIAQGLFCQALGEQRYAEIKDTVVVGSYNKLARAWHSDEYEKQIEMLKEKYDIHGQYKKRLLSLDKTLDLDWTVLIDDDISYVYDPKNILKILPADASTFREVFQGEPENLDKNVHNIFYAAGFLFSALKLIEDRFHTITLSEALFKMQFAEEHEEMVFSQCQAYEERVAGEEAITSRVKKLSPESRLFYPALDEIPEDRRKYTYCQEHYLPAKTYYDRGLSYLQQVNPTLIWLSKDNFLRNYEINRNYKCYDPFEHRRYRVGLFQDQPSTDLMALRPQNLDRLGMKP